MWGGGEEAAGTPRPQSREAGPAGGRGLSPPPPRFAGQRRFAGHGGSGAGAPGLPGAAAPGLRRLFGPTVTAGEPGGGWARRGGGNKAENNFPLPRSWRCPAEPSAPLGGAGQRRRGLSAARRERAAPSFPPFFPPSRGRRRGAGPGEGTRSPDPRNAARPPRGLPPARHREGLLPAEPLRRACSAAGGAQRRGRPGAASRPPGPRRGLLTLVAMALPVRAGLPVSSPRRGPRLLGQCVPPARRRWAAQAAPPQPPPVAAAAWGPLGG